MCEINRKVYITEYQVPNSYFSTVSPSSNKFHSKLTSPSNKRLFECHDQPHSKSLPEPNCHQMWSKIHH